MSGDVRGDALHGDSDDPFAHWSQTADSEHGVTLYWELTVRIHNDLNLLELSDVVNILTAVVRVYVKLYLLRGQSPASVVEYAANPASPLMRQVTRTNSPTVLRMTMNSPATFVLGVSEVVGLALKSLIDAVSQARIRYDRAKLDLKRAEVALARDDAKWELRQKMQELELMKQADEHRMAMLERTLDLQARIQALITQDDKARQAEYFAQMDMRKHITDACQHILAQEHPGASEELQEVLTQAFTEDLFELAEHSPKLTAESLQPRKSA